MITRRRTSLVVVMLAIAAVIGGVVCPRFRGVQPDEPVTKVDDPAHPSPVTKATAPARMLNEKERMLVGKWKFQKCDPPLLPPSYAAVFEYAADGTCTLATRSEYHEPRVRPGTYRVVGDLIVTEFGPDTDQGGNSLIETLTEDRLVKSSVAEGTRWVLEWSRAR